MKERHIIKERIYLFGDGRDRADVMPSAGELPPGRRQARGTHASHGGWGSMLLGGLRVLAIAVAFVAIFYTFLNADMETSGTPVTTGVYGNDSGNIVLPAAATVYESPSDSGVVSETAAGDPVGTADGVSPTADAGTTRMARKPYYVLDQAGVGLVLEFITQHPAYSLAPLLPKGEIGVIIIHTHGNECCTAGVRVTEYGEKLTAMLEESGIGCFHCEAEHDADSLIGAYSRMRITLTRLLEAYPSAFLVIDLHSSDTPSPLTLTVGVGEKMSGNGEGDNVWWQENLLLARAVCESTVEVQPTLRLLPGDLGQNSGALTLTVGIGSPDTPPDVADRAVSALATALVSLAGTDN